MDERKNKGIPNPEDIQKDLESLIRNKYGGGVQFFTMGGPQQETAGEPVIEPPEAQEFDLNFQLTPKEVKAYLDRYVIRQDEAKKALAIAVCDHYHHVRECVADPSLKDADYSKQNILMLGPTGVGKTYLVKLIAKLVGVPFVKADATRFSETGYVGSNVDDLVKDLVRQANGDIDLAQYGIVYVDEADKLATPPNLMGRDVSGRGVQFGLLKLMEETEVDLRSGNDIQSQIQSFMEFQQKGKVERQVINTRHILFIVSGAFSQMTEIVKDRLERRRIGITSNVRSDAEEAEDNILAQASTEDFIKFGFEPEFIGRLPVRVACEHLSVDDLYHVLKDSEGSIIRQYKRSFQSYGIKLQFEDDALRAIAEKAHLEKTGARALMTVCEKILRDFKFELPSMPIKKFIVTRAVVENPDEEMRRLLEDETYVKKLQWYEQIRQFSQGFRKASGLKIDFTEEAVEEILAKGETQSMEPKELLPELFKGYEHGLLLIEKNIGQKEFLLDLNSVLNPQKAIEDWIRDSYQ